VDSKWQQETRKYTCRGWQKVNQQKTFTQHKKEPKEKMFYNHAMFHMLISPAHDTRPSF